MSGRRAGGWESVVARSHAGGSFSTVDGAPCAGIAHWTGTAWTNLGEGVSSDYYPSVTAMVEWDEDESDPGGARLFVAGYFETAGGIQTGGIARWDGYSWSRVGDVVGGHAGAMIVYDDDTEGPHPRSLYTSGYLTMEDGVTLWGILRWNGAEWDQIYNDEDPFVQVTAFAVFDEDGEGAAPIALYALAENIDGYQFGLLRWDGTDWLIVGIATRRFTPTVRALAVFDEDGAGPNASGLFVGGLFDAFGGQSAEGIARYGLKTPYIWQSPGSLWKRDGESALFDVQAGGSDDMAYQWRRDGVPLADDGRVVGAQSSRLRIAAVNPADQGDYDVIVSNAYGQVASRPARLDVPCLAGRADGDINLDGRVNALDLQVFVSTVLNDDRSADRVCRADFSGDRRLGFEDVSGLIDALLDR